MTPAPRAHILAEMLRRGDPLLGVVLATIAAIDATLALAVPAVLGYPRGGIFLLEGLPVIAAALAGGALVAAPILVALRRSVGALASTGFVLALLLLAGANAYLWVLCVSSV